MAGGDIPGRRQSKCKGPGVREGLGRWRNSKRSAVAGGEGEGGERRKMRAEEEWGRIAPGPVDRGEDDAFTLSELGAAGGLRAEEELI